MPKKGHRIPGEAGRAKREASATGNADSLRKRAETLLSRNNRNHASSGDMRELLHELSVHQVELNLQNEELRIARDEAEASQQQYFNLYDLAPIGHAGLDRAGKIVDINLTGAAVLGLQRRYCAGRFLETFLEPKDRSVFDGFLRRVFQTGQKESCTVTMKKGTEESRTFRIEAILPGGPTAKPPVCRAALIDVTEQTVAERKLIETSRYLATIIDSTTGPIVIWDPHHRITLFNTGFERLTGKPASSVIGKPLEVLFPAEERRRAMEKIRIADSGLIEGVEIPVISNSRVKEVLWNAAALYGEDGQWMATVAQGQDISDLKTTERNLLAKVEELDMLNTQLKALGEDLKRKEEKLTDSLAEKEILLAEIHHRVKNNLASFISLLSLDGSYEDTPGGRQLRNDLQNRARTMALIHETLYRTRQFSRVDMEEYLSTLVRQVVGSCKSAVPMEAQVDVRDITLDLGRAMPVGLIVNELLTNAIKYAWPHDFDSERVRGEPPAIMIGLSRGDDGYLLSVRDNGIGLPSSVDPAQVRTLGLKLVYFLAKHQLRAIPDLNRDHGTSFEFRIPANLNSS